MKTNIGMFFGGRSTEHEISVISASQAMAAIDRGRYDVTPIYITKQGRWYTGDALLDVRNYRDPASLLKKCTEVYMRPVYGDYNIYPAKPSGFFGGGGGMLCVPLLQFRGLDVKRAHATALIVILPLCIVSAAIYIANGYFDANAVMCAISE